QECRHPRNVAVRINSARLKAQRRRSAAHAKRATGDGEGTWIAVSRLPILHQQIAAHRVSIDRPVQMATAVKVVRQAGSKAFSQVLVEANVCLLGGCVHKTLGLRVSEWLESQRKSRVNVVLIDEQ